MSNKSKVILVSSILILVIIISYRIYAPQSIQNFNAVNLKNIEKVKNDLDNKDSFSFVVLGNIKNSIRIFDKKILPKIRQDDIDFIISTGNNVVDSGEGKYRVLYRSLSTMQVPFITGVGENEVKEGGYKNYYKYFGPFYFSFQADDSYFIFLDTTGHSPEAWQKTWLKNELQTSLQYDNCFVIMNKPPQEVDVDYLLDEETKYISSQEDRNYYQQIFSKYNVTSVFSSNLEISHKQVSNSIPYFISGGAGGAMVLDNPQSFYHYLKVDLTPTGVSYEVVEVDKEFGFLHPKLAKFIENVWIFLQSFMYTNYTTVLLVLVIIFMLSFMLYLELRREVDYYREFAGEDEKLPNRKLRIAIFTNNYFPFIGGVPISIARLSKGLQKLGHEVYIFAPEYPQNSKESELNVIRCKTFWHQEQNGMELPIVNIFSNDIEDKFNELDFDLVHAHHPIWLGSKGLSLAEKYEIPSVLTYHTRLEKYTHYLPDFRLFKKLFRNRIAHYIIKKAANRSDAVFAPTENAKEYLRNIGVSKHIKVLPTGIDFDDYQLSEQEINSLASKYKRDDEVILLSVSRLSKEKNLYFLMKSLKYIKENTNLKFKCLIVGDGSEKENLADYIIENDLKEYVELIGTIDYKEISKYYNLADVFVFASKSETQGMVLLEAMAGKTPVVAVRSSGIDNVIENGFNGYKVAEDVSQWSGKVIKLIENKKLLADMSDNAYQYAQDNSIEEMAQDAVGVYNKFISYDSQNKE
jgi:glycosyltransferase involved in cell wall biosynthesis